MPDIRSLEAVLFLDLETTGTDEHNDYILEVGAYVCRPDGIGHVNDTEDAFHKIIRPKPLDGQKDWQARLFNSFTVLKMHVDNGLLEAILAEPHEKTREEVDFAFSNFLEQHPYKLKRHQVMLAGSGVSHFDRRFLRVQMPMTEAWLQYPNLDVGIMRRLIQLSRRTLTDLIPIGEEQKPHRALEDAKWSMEEARRYVRFLHEARIPGDTRSNGEGQDPNEAPPPSTVEKPDWPGAARAADGNG